MRTLSPWDPTAGSSSSALLVRRGSPTPPCATGILPVLLLIFVLLPGVVSPLPAAEPSLTATQIARLESLCRVWGVVKFFHPWIVAPPDGKSIDWDAALIETIPLVEKAATAEEFRAAIDHLLSALHDSAT